MKNRTSLIFLALSLLYLSISIFALAGCNGGETQPPPHTHTLTKVDAKTATCTESGNVLYYTCSGCEKKFSDAAGENEVTEVTLLAGHDMQEVTAIGERAFYDVRNCASTLNITSITIPSSVTSIGVYAFSGCRSLESINFLGTKAEWSAITKDGYSDYTVHCTDGDLTKAES